MAELEIKNVSIFLASLLTQKLIIGPTHFTDTLGIIQSEQDVLFFRGKMTNSSHKSLKKQNFPVELAENENLVILKVLLFQKKEGLDLVTAA